MSLKYIRRELTDAEITDMKYLADNPGSAAFLMLCAGQELSENSGAEVAQEQATYSIAAALFLVAHEMKLSRERLEGIDRSGL
jgi:hypothetical protein